MRTNKGVGKLWEWITACKIRQWHRHLVVSCDCGLLFQLQHHFPRTNWRCLQPCGSVYIRKESNWEWSGYRNGATEMISRNYIYEHHQREKWLLFTIALICCGIVRIYNENKPRIFCKDMALSVSRTCQEHFLLQQNGQWVSRFFANITSYLFKYGLWLLYQQVCAFETAKNPTKHLFRKIIAATLVT